LPALWVRKPKGDPHNVLSWSVFLVHQQPARSNGRIAFGPIGYRIGIQHRGRALFGMLKPPNTTTITCKVCDSVYLRRANPVNIRGKDGKIREVCGEVVEGWEGKRQPTFKLVKRGTLTQR
jgi:hypothetical protein